MKCVQWWYFLVHDWLKLYQSDYQKLSMYAEVRCVVLFEAEIHFGRVLAGLLATANLLTWSKVFHVKFYPSI